MNRGSHDVCRLWLERRCPHGDSCKFSHPAGRGGPLVASQASEEGPRVPQTGQVLARRRVPFAHVAKEKPLPTTGGSQVVGASRGRRRGSAGRGIGVSTRILRAAMRHSAVAVGRRWRPSWRLPCPGGEDRRLWSDPPLGLHAADTARAEPVGIAREVSGPRGPAPSPPSWLRRHQNPSRGAGAGLRLVHGQPRQLGRTRRPSR